MRTISSQTYRDPAIVAAKRAAKDYAAQYVEIEVDGEWYRVVMDGHHSLEAAKMDGAEVVWELHREFQREADRTGPFSFLTEHCWGDDYCDIETGYPVF